jgi:hypothetical protein
LSRGGPATVVTTPWVLRFDPVKREAYMARVHPGVYPEEVRENTDWALPVSTQMAVPPSPAPEKVRHRSLNSAPPVRCIFFLDKFRGTSYKHFVTTL